VRDWDVKREMGSGFQEAICQKLLKEESGKELNHLKANPMKPCHQANFDTHSKATIW